MAASETTTTDSSDPIPTDDALLRLDTAAFVDLVTDLWEARGWTLTEERTVDAGTVNARLRQRWPHRRTGLLQVQPYGPNERLNRADVQQFVRTVQREDVDVAYLVSATPVSTSVREIGAEYGVVVIDPEELARLIDRSAAHGLLAQRLSRPVAPVTEPFELPWILGKVNRGLGKLPYDEKLKRWVDGRVPENPTTDDVTSATYTGFRVAYLCAAITFGLLFLVRNESLVGLLLIFLIVSITYGGLLPVLAADIYVTRRSENAQWTPTWWTLASFVLYPLPLFVGGFYWYRRRERTPVAG